MHHKIINENRSKNKYAKLWPNTDQIVCDRKTVKHQALNSMPKTKLYFLIKCKQIPLVFGTVHICFAIGDSVQVSRYTLGLVTLSKKLTSATS